MQRMRSERGAILPIVALLLTSMIGMAAFAVDIGMQRVVRRDMQALADAVALDLARLLDGRKAGEIRAAAGDEGLSVALAKSVARNDDSTLGEPPSVQAVLIELDAHGDPVRVAGNLKAVPDDDVPDAVLVTASTSVDFAFSSGSGSATRTAIGNSESVGCFRLGSYAASVDPANPGDPESAKVNDMLLDALGVTAVGYHGLASSSVSLGGLAAELDAATPDELIALKSVKLREIFAAAGVALAREGGDSADVTLLQTLAVSARSTLDATLDLDRLLTITSDSGAVFGSEINVLDLVASSVYSTDGTHFLDIGNLWTVPKFSEGDQSLQLIERPRLACGPVGPATRAETAQLRFTADPGLNTQFIGLADGETSAVLNIDLVGASGVLTSVTCGEGTLASPESVEVAVTRSPATVDLSIDVTLSGQMKLSDLGLFDLTDLGLFGALTLPGPSTKATIELTVDAGSSVVGSAATETRVYSVPPRTYADAEVVGDATAVALPPVTIERSDITGTVTYNGRTFDVTSDQLSSTIDLSTIIEELQTELAGPAINELIANVNAELTTVATLLGLHVNGVDLLGVPRPTCDNPALRG